MRSVVMSDCIWMTALAYVETVQQTLADICICIC